MRQFAVLFVLVRDRTVFLSGGLKTGPYGGVVLLHLFLVCTMLYLAITD